MYCGLMSMGLSSIINSKERKGEKKERKERKGKKNMFRVNYYQSAFNAKKTLNILAEMLKISQIGLACRSIYDRPPSL